MNRQINHKVMRAIVGIIAFLLSPIVIWLDGNPELLTSVSSSYWSDARDIFVGSLIVVGFFLAAYNGSHETRDKEYYISKVACLFAIGVALFPTASTKVDSCKAITEGPAWIQGIAGFFGLTPDCVHQASAILLFACLIALIFYFSARARKKGAHFRSKGYKAIGLLMAVGIIGIFAAGKLSGSSHTILWVEIWGLTWFGVGWFWAGTYKSINPKTP